MNRKLVAALAVVLNVQPVAALAQGEPEPTGPSQDAAWHNAQQLALASRQASEGWAWLAGGLLWRRVAGDGSGKHPTIDDTVTLHYAGTLVDGTVGDTIEIALPATLGYGPIGRGPIPGGATLLFKIELIGIPSQ